MKKSLVVFLGINLLALPQLALTDDSADFQQRCEQQAIEDNVDASLYDDYVVDCVRYLQDSEPQLQEEPELAEEEPEKESSDRY